MFVTKNIVIFHRWILKSGIMKKTLMSFIHWSIILQPTSNLFTIILIYLDKVRCSIRHLLEIKIIFFFQYCLVISDTYIYICMYLKIKKIWEQCSSLSSVLFCFFCLFFVLKRADSALTDGTIYLSIIFQRWNIDIISSVHNTDWWKWINYFSTSNIHDSNVIFYIFL